MWASGNKVRRQTYRRRIIGGKDLFSLGRSCNPQNLLKPFLDNHTGHPMQKWVLSWV